MRRVVGWPGNLPDLNLVKSYEEDAEVGKCFVDDGPEKLHARYGDKSCRNTQENSMGQYQDKWRWLSQPRVAF